MNELLMIVGAIFLLCAVVGFARGFIRIVASLVATLAIVVAVIIATPYVSDALCQYTPIDSMLEEKCVSLLTPGDESGEKLYNTDYSRDEQIKLIENSSMPQIFKDLLLENNNSEVYESLGVDSFGQYVGKYFAKLFSDIIAFLVTFVLATILIRTILYIVGVIGDLPVIGGLNRLAGGAVGLVVGLLIVWILLVVITITYENTLCARFLENVAENQFLTFLYDHNILMKFLTGFKI